MSDKVNIHPDTITVPSAPQENEFHGPPGSTASPTYHNHSYVYTTSRPYSGSHVQGHEKAQNNIQPSKPKDGQMTYVNTGQMPYAYGNTPENIPYGWRPDLVQQTYPEPNAYSQIPQGEPLPDYISSMNSNSFAMELSRRKQDLLKTKAKLLYLQNELSRRQTSVYKSTVRNNADIIPYTTGGNDQVFQNYEKELSDLIHQIRITQEILKQNYDERFIAGTSKKKVKLEYEGCCGCCPCVSGPSVIYVNDLCDRKPKLHFDGCCNLSKVNVDICSNEQQHIDWIWGNQSIVVEGMFSSPIIKLTGTLVNPKIQIEGVRNRPIIQITGICVNPKINVEGVSVKPTIHVIGTCHRPVITVNGVECKVKFNVTGICNKPIVKGSCKTKFYVVGLFKV